MAVVWSVLAQLLHIALVLAAAPVLTGVVRWLKARIMGRRGAHPLQPLRDLLKLLRKKPVMAENASAVSLAAPYLAAGAAMAAAALVYLEGGNPQQCADAAAFALMNLLGLVCDPVGGLVEVPCVYRNVGASGIAFTAADMALSGIRCPIEPDEVILAMKEVGDALPTSLRETGEGGCAACESICKRLHHKE